MNPEREDQQFQRGCLAAFILLLASCLLAYFVDRAFLWLAGGVILVWEIVSRRRARRERARLDDALAEAFNEFRGPLPELKTGTSYGFPSFTLTFPDTHVLEAAQQGGHIGRFKRAVSDLYAHCGTEKRPFDAEMAVWATYEGWMSSTTEV